METVTIQSDVLKSITDRLKILEDAKTMDEATILKNQQDITQLKLETGSGRQTSNDVSASVTTSAASVTAAASADAASQVATETARAIAAEAAINLNVGNKFSYFEGGILSGNTTLPTIAIGETMFAWYGSSAATNRTFTLPATGTFNWTVVFTAAISGTAPQRAQAGGATFTLSLTTGVVYLIIYTRTA